ncbi:aminotransferase [Mesorhizobium loti]|uniref:Aminotransferase n=2 Tax=Rhizobium loti TaxID=381 RepID=A0A1A5Q013_RHILI|nr:aminotransferase [Mesorhizobium loti]OBP74353.1 aminotransferase [Mesorhizobium loti]OBQ60844.1 aminotransferase [Mesorhizobium loti]QKC69914.1 aminotransferase [Mesorhizobium loti]
MHDCGPPSRAMDRWLEPYSTVEGTYGHLLLEEKEDRNRNLASALVPYFESAHRDAREHFAEQIGIDLHPDAEQDDVDDAALLYPGCLPMTAKRGLFGEVIAGLVTEQYEFVGKHKWSIPIFLFRYHADVEKYLFDLARDAARVRAVFGRLGSDFLGISLDHDGAVVRLIVGEAKWRETLNRSTVDNLMLGDWKVRRSTGERFRKGGVWFEINRDLPVPHGVRQLQRLLSERDRDGYAAAIVSLDRALVLRNPVPIPRTNLIMIAGDGAATREPRSALIGWEETPAEYTSPNDLQVVELILNRGAALIDQIYDLLWAED